MFYILEKYPKLQEIVFQKINLFIRIHSHT